LKNGIITIAKQHTERAFAGEILRGFFHAQTEVIQMGYRKVSALEQIWYILCFKLREIFRKEDNRAK